MSHLDQLFWDNIPLKLESCTENYLKTSQRATKAEVISGQIGNGHTHWWDISWVVGPRVVKLIIGFGKALNACDYFQQTISILRHKALNPA